MGILGFHSSCNRLVRPPLDLRQGTQISSRVAIGDSGLLSSYEGEHRVHLTLQQGSRASSQVKVGNSGFLLSCNRGVGPPLKLSWGNSFSAGVCRVALVAMSGSYSLVLARDFSILRSGSTL